MIIKNQTIKFFIYNHIFPIISWVNGLYEHKREQIFLYCNLSFRDNNKAIYDYLIANGYHHRYRIVVSSSDYREYIASAPENVRFIGAMASIFAYLRSKYVFYCIGKLPIVPGPGQQVIHMEHGMPFKEASEGQQKYSIQSQHYTHVMATGPAFVDVQCRWYAVGKEKIVIAGNPKCDPLFQPNPKYEFGCYDKIILWTPTFRKSVSMAMQDTEQDAAILPIIDVEDFAKFNDYLKSINVKIVVKLHPEQDLSKYNLLEMDHFILLSHQEFMKRGMDLYRFMKQCDGMITDYSSIFYDFMILDRPIGFTEDDIDDYAGKRGFAMDPDVFRPGMRIRNYNDLCQFAVDIAKGKDDFANEREEINHVVNPDREGHYSQKVLDIMGIH